MTSKPPRDEGRCCCHVWNSSNFSVFLLYLFSGQDIAVVVSLRCVRVIWDSAASLFNILPSRRNHSFTPKLHEVRAWVRNFAQVEVYCATIASLPVYPSSEKASGTIEACNIHPCPSQEHVGLWTALCKKTCGLVFSSEPNCPWNKLWSSQVQPAPPQN